MTGGVTLRRRCYVVPCVACRGLYVAHRTDSRTCSGACRIALHRSADLGSHWEAAARFADVDSFTVRRADAVARLLPERLADLRTGVADLDDLLDDLHRAWWRRIEEAEHAS